MLYLSLKQSVGNTALRYFCYGDHQQTIYKLWAKMKCPELLEDSHVFLPSDQTPMRPNLTH